MRRILLLLLMASTSCTTKPDRAESTKLPERTVSNKDHVSTKDASAYEVTPGEHLIIYSGSVAAGSFKIIEKTLNILTKHHITTIVCLKSCSFSVEMAEEKGFTVETLDYDPQSGPSTEMIKTFLSIYQKRKGLIFINSDPGSSGLLIMGIRIQKMGWTRKSALKEYMHFAKKSSGSIEFFKRLAFLKHNEALTKEFLTDTWVICSDISTYYMTLNSNGSFSGKSIHQEEKYSYTETGTWTLNKDTITITLTSIKPQSSGSGANTTSAQKQRSYVIVNFDYDTLTVDAQKSTVTKLPRAIKTWEIKRNTKTLSQSN